MQFFIKIKFKIKFFDSLIQPFHCNSKYNNYGKIGEYYKGSQNYLELVQ